MFWKIRGCSFVGLLSNVQILSAICAKQSLTPQTDGSVSSKSRMSPRATPEERTQQCLCFINMFSPLDDEYLCEFNVPWEPERERETYKDRGTSRVFSRNLLTLLTWKLPVCPYKAWASLLFWGSWKMGSLLWINIPSSSLRLLPLIVRHPPSHPPPSSWLHTLPFLDTARRNSL